MSQQSKHIQESNTTNINNEQISTSEKNFSESANEDITNLTVSKLYPKTFHILFGKYLDAYLNELDTYYHDFHCQPNFMQLNQKELNETYPLVRDKSLLETRFHDYILYQLAQLTINKKLNKISDQSYFDDQLVNPTITCTRFEPVNQELDIVIFDSNMKKLTSFEYNKKNMISFIFNESNDNNHFLNAINDYVNLTDKSYKEFSHLIYGAINDYQDGISNKKASNHNDNQYYPHSYLDADTTLQTIPEKMLDYIEERIVTSISNIGSFNNDVTQIPYDSGMSMLQAFFDVKEKMESKVSNNQSIKISDFLSQFRDHFIDERLKEHLSFLEEKFSAGIDFKLDKVIVLDKDLTHNWIPKAINDSLDSVESNLNNKKKMKP